VKEIARLNGKISNFVTKSTQKSIKKKIWIKEYFLF
jgi:phosphopantetheine adenylyltransferase